MRLTKAQTIGLLEFPRNQMSLSNILTKEIKPIKRGGTKRKKAKKKKTTRRKKR